MNKIRRVSILLLSSLTTLSGCSFSLDFTDNWFADEPPPHIEEPTLKTLENTNIVANPSKLPDATLQQAKDSYLRLLNTAKSENIIAESLQRLAEIEGLMAENALFRNDQQQTSEHLDLSEGYYRRLLNEFPQYINETETRYQLARILSLNGKAEKSLAYLDNLSKLPSKEMEAIEARFRLAETAFSRKDYRGAYALYNRVIAEGKSTEFYNTALYKRGWSYFKVQKYHKAFNDFTTLLDHVYEPEKTRKKSIKSLMSDTYRVAALSLSYLQGPDSAKKFFKEHGHKRYESEMYKALAQLYDEQDRFQDTAETYFAFVETNPLDSHAPELESLGINVLGKAGFVDLVLDAKKRFVEHYSVNSQYWQKSGRARSTKVAGWLKSHLNDVTGFYHAEAQKSKKKADYLEVARWYRLFLENFPDDKDAVNKRWLLAEALTDGGKSVEAAEHYHVLAYEPSNLKKSRKEEAGYRVILSRQNSLKLTEDNKIKNAKTRAAISAARLSLINASLEYRKAFVGAKRVPQVLAQVVELQVTQGQIKPAIENARDLIHLPKVTRKQKARAREIVANGEFDLKNYAAAEIAINNIFRKDRPRGEIAKNFHERRAQAIYKQGEQAKTAGKLNEAVKHFLRLGKIEKKSPVRINAEYDAGTLLLQMKEYSRAVGVLTAFASKYPKHKLAKDIPAKLVLAYESTGNWRGAAREYEKVAASSKDINVARTAVWQAGQSWMKINNKAASEKATEIWKRYVKTYPEPVDLSLEARQNLVDLYGKLKVRWKQDFWRRKIIAEVSTRKLSDDRARLLAGKAQIALTETDFSAFKAVKLKQPLAKSLKKKQKLLKATLKGYGKVLDYGIARLSTQAGHRIGESYAILADSLMNSQRPRGLTPLQLEEYDALLEERVFPFEDQAIEALEANIKQAHRSAWDVWVDKSLDELKKLMPARYNKPEAIDDFVNSL